MILNNIVYYIRQLGVIWYNLQGKCIKNIENNKYELFMVLVGSLCNDLSMLSMRYIYKKYFVWNILLLNDLN